MRTVRYACIALLAALVVVAPASADEVLVLGKDGRARERDDRHLTATRMPRPRAGAVATAAQRKKKKRRTVAGELKRLRDTGRITPEDYAARRAFYDEVKRQARTLSGAAQDGDARGARRGRGDRRAPAADAQPAGAAVADAAAQPRVVDHRAAARLRPAGRVPGLRAGLAVLPRPGPAAPDARQLRQAERAVGHARERAAGGDARRAAAAGGRAGRRARVGVLLHVRRRPAAVGERARAGDRGAGAGARGHAAAARGRRAADRPARAGRVRDARPRGRARAGVGGRPLRDLLVRARPARAQRLRAGVERLCTTTRACPATRAAPRCSRRASRRRGSRSRPTTPAPGRCTRAAARCASPTSATTTC